MKWSRLIVASLAVIPLLACQFASSFFPSTSNQVVPPTDSGQIIEAPVSPIRISVSPDAGRTVEAAIPVEGGALNATGADGTFYQLVIPPTALPQETQITMTPVAAISGMPFGGEQTYAVQLAPEGLSLFDFATLTITPPQPIPVNQQILFGYRGTGENLILALPVKDSQEINIQLLHFSGYGATAEVNSSGYEPVGGQGAHEILLLGDNADSRMENVAAAQAQNERRGTSTEGIDFETAYEVYKEQVLNPRIKAAGDSCAAGRQALESILSAIRQAQLLGSDAINEELYAEIVRLVPIVADNCMKEEYERCESDHIFHRILPLYLGWQRQYQLILEGAPGMQDLDMRLQKYVEKCLRFEVVFESTVVNGAPDNGFESRVKATVPMNFSFAGGWKYVGQAPLVNEAFEFRIPDKDCTPIANRGGGTFESPQLSFTVENATPEDQIGRVSKLFLNYFPGETSEEFGWVCKDSSAGPMKSPMWTGMFIAAHEADANAEGGFTAADWEIFGDEYYAKKEWQIDKPDLELVEVGTFKLYHKPGG